LRKITVPENRPESWKTFIKMGQKGFKYSIAGIAAGVCSFIFSLINLFMSAPNQIIISFLLFLTIVAFVFSYFAQIFIRVQTKMNETYKYIKLSWVFMISTWSLCMLSVVLYVVGLFV
jgi:hypothetical protein